MLMHLIDQWHRQLNYLRVSVTDRCNLQCLYCRTEPVFQKLKHDDILRYEEILRIIKVSLHLGITKVRITGGEPLVRRDIFPFLSKLSSMDGIQDLSFTSNGTLLARNIPQIVNAGIRRINVSLDTLNPDKYITITGVDKWHQVWDGLIAAHHANIYPIKLNVVAMNGINDDEWIDFARLTQRYPFFVRFIELMPVGHSDLFSCRWVSSETIKNTLISHFGTLVPVKNQVHDGPAERFKLIDGQGEIGFIHAISHHFCQTCNRLRLTANGQLRACLLSDLQVDLKTLIRKGCSDSDIKDHLMSAIKLKPFSHSDSSKECHEQMIRIGG